jgi:predicted RNase H-like nuclease (RuvC/YqgF family)
MILNQTANPFAKKPNDTTPAGSPDRSGLKSMHELSLNYANLLEENRQLKSENRHLKGGAMTKKQPLDRSQNMIELLGSLDEREEREAREAKFLEYEQAIGALKRENDDLRRRMSETSQKRGVGLSKQSRYLPQ